MVSMEHLFEFEVSCSSRESELRERRERFAPAPPMIPDEARVAFMNDCFKQMFHAGASPSPSCTHAVRPIGATRHPHAACRPPRRSPQATPCGLHCG